MQRFGLLFVLLSFSLISIAQISFSPSSGEQGSSFTVTITGVGTTFTQGTTTCARIVVSGEAYNLSDVEVQNATTMSGMLSIPEDAPTGEFNGSVWSGPNGCEGEEWTCEECFTINAAVECALQHDAQATDVTCTGADDGSADANVTGANGSLTYLWSNGATTASITGLSPGTYTFMASDAEGCDIMGEVIVDEPPPIQIMIDGISSVSCFGEADGSINISASGGTGMLSYFWDTGIGSTEDPGNLIAGTYTLSVQDANNCTELATAEVTEPDEIIISTFSTGESMVGANDGTASVEVTGGTIPYMYEWSSGDTTSMIMDKSPGVYDITLTDAKGCMSMASVSIDSISCSLSITESVTEPLCAGDSTGSFSLEVSGGTEPLTFDWEGGDFTGALSNLLSGTYEVTVTDAEGCASSISIVINEPDPIQIQIDSTKSDDGSGSGAVFVSVMGGTGTYTFEWVGDTQTVDVVEDLVDANAGDYILEVLDANGCLERSDTQTIELVTSVVLTDFGGTFTLFPNPTRGILAIKSDFDPAQIGRNVQIYDLKGQVVKTTQVGDLRSIDISDLTAGTYFLSMQVGTQHLTTRVIKQ